MKKPPNYCSVCKKLLIKGTHGSKFEDNNCKIDEQINNSISLSNINSTSTTPKFHKSFLSSSDD